MKISIRYLSDIGIAAWVMASVLAVIAYGLCLGTAEAISSYGHDTSQRL